MWTLSLFKYLSPTRTRPGAVLRRPPTSRLRFEELEDRRVPSFGTATVYDTSYGPLSADVGDFNGDGRPDVVGATQLGIAVRLNNGAGTLGNEVLYSVDEYHNSTAVGDLNADGNPDVAAITGSSTLAGGYYDQDGNFIPEYTSSGHVRIMFGNGDGTFTVAPASYDINQGRNTEAVLADLDADGNLDLAISNLDAYMSVLLGNGDGTFEAPQFVPVSAIRDVDVADLNGDGNLDLIACDAFNNAAYRLLGNGDGSFQPPQAIATFGPIEQYPTTGGQAVGDINGDGTLDLAVTYNLWYGSEEYGIAYAQGHVQALIGNGDGTFTAGNSYLVEAGYIEPLELADFDGDGQLDIVIGGYGSGNVSLLHGNGDGTFDSPDPASAEDPGGGPNDIAVGDLDGNGALDVVTVNHGWNTWSVLLNGVSQILSLGISDAAVAEGNTGTRAATFTVTLSAASAQAVTVAYATADGSAAAGSDYQGSSGILTIPAGQTTGIIAFLVYGDRLAESNETFFVNLSSPANATIADGQGVGTIQDDEPRVSISDVTKSEGRRNKKTLFTFTVTLSVAYDQPVTMSFQTVNGTATTGDNDYVAKSGTLTFAPGETSKTITITVKGDSKREANETFYVDLSGLSINAIFTKNRGIGTILNDD